jgi:hypothetical protein
MSSNQPEAQIDEGGFPFRKKKVLEQYQFENSTDSLSQPLRDEGFKTIL